MSFSLEILVCSGEQIIWIWVCHCYYNPLRTLPTNTLLEQCAMRSLSTSVIPLIIVALLLRPSFYYIRHPNTVHMFSGYFWFMIMFRKNVKDLSLR